MKFSTYILAMFAAAGLTRAGTPPTQPGPNTYVRVLYEDRTVRYFDFGVCYPYEVDGSLAVMAVWLQSTTCYSNEKPDCSGGIAPPVGVPVPGGTVLVNAADFVQLIGQAAMCYKNELPGIPLLPAFGL